MAPRTVLACLTDEAGAPALSRAAAALAGVWNAHLVGLHVMEGLVFYPSFRVELPQSVYRNVRDQQHAHAAELERTFRGATGDMGAHAEWRLLSAEGGLTSDRIVESARAADLVIMGAASGDDRIHRQRFLQEAVIRGSGRPVLVIPAGAEVEGLRRAMVGWRDTAEATRALHDLLPLLAPGAAVRLVAFGEGPRLGERGGVMTDLGAALDRHGLAVEIERRTDAVRSVAAALEAEAREFGADVLAVGAYGRSRAHDLILGAVSRSLLREARMPVLFSR